MSAQRTFTFSTTDGILARSENGFPSLWREQRQRWEPYYDIYEFAHNSYPIDEAEAKKLIGDGDLYAPTFYRGEAAGRNGNGQIGHGAESSKPAAS